MTVLPSSVARGFYRLPGILGASRALVGTPRRACAPIRQSVRRPGAEKVASQYSHRVPLGDEILQHFAEDQRLRTAYAAALNAGEEQEAEALFRTILDRVDEHSEWLRGLLSAGWPNREEIGAEAAEALGLLVNHGDESVHRLALPLVSDAVEAGNAPPWILAFVTDQVLVADGLPQRYGTFLRDDEGALVVPPIEDESRVDERRVEVGLGPISEHLARAKPTFRLS